MADTLFLVGPVELTTTAATVLDVDTLPVTIIDLHVCNESGSARTFTISIGTDGDGKRLFKEFPIEPNGVVQRTGNIPLAVGTIIQAYASANDALTLTMGGVATS